MSLYVFYQSTIIYIFSPTLAPDHESTERDCASISFNTTYHQVGGYTTALVSWDAPVSQSALTLVMIQVNSHCIHFV